MNNASAQFAPTTEHALRSLDEAASGEVSLEEIRQFVAKWAPFAQRGAFIMDLGFVISAVGSQIVRAANGDGEAR